MKRRKTKFNDNIKKTGTLCNYDIREPQVRIVGADGEQLGIKPTDVGIKIAKSQGLDLVMVSNKAKPPVCKIVDLNKFEYAQTKKKKAIEKSQRQSRTVTKEIRFGVNIADNDLNVKANHIKKFFSDKYYVKVNIPVHGRQKLHFDKTYELFDKLENLIDDEYEFVSKPSRQGNSLVSIIKPITKHGPQSNKI